jgi:hypothetical protein
MIEGHIFVDAYFTNNERTVVETVWFSEDDQAYRTYNIIAEDGEADWHKLLETINVDDIHERTYKKIKEQDEILKDSVVEVATERGLIYDVNVVSSDMYNALVRVLFDKFDEEEHKEKLFMMKLKLFEYPAIQRSKNNKLKSELRKAKTPLEATKIAIQIAEG